MSIYSRIPKVGFRSNLPSFLVAVVVMTGRGPQTPSCHTPIASASITLSGPQVLYMPGPMIIFRSRKIDLPSRRSVSRRRNTVERPTAVPQTFRGLLGGDVALGLGHELVADEELPHGGAA
jgi:hypothetical protein